MRLGRFITFEGIDGCGKTTQLRLLADWLRHEAGLDVVSTREPGGTPLGAEIRRLLLDADRFGTPVPESELLLFLADRAQHVRRVIQPALASYRWVLCDRFSDSTRAYQLAARGLAGRAGIDPLLDFATCGVQPDLTLWFDLPPETALTRVQARTRTGGPGNRIDAEAIDFHRRVAASFAAIAAREPGRVIRIDAEGDAEEVALRVRRAVQSRFGLQDSGS
ncbi:MAG: dTMP kinase [Mariprofundaceae bacterium]